MTELLDSIIDLLAMVVQDMHDVVNRDGDYLAAAEDAEANAEVALDRLQILRKQLEETTDA